MAKEKNDNIENVVLKCFIRVIKSDGKYLFYRRKVRNNGLIGYLIGNRTPSDGPFRDAKSTIDVVAILKRLTNEMTSKSGKTVLDKYEHVTMTINHLLHFFVECYGIKMDELCSMGEEIYNLSCNKLFGDTLEDLRKQSEEEINNITNPQMLTAKLFNEYVNGIKQGTLNHTMTFDEFVKTHAKVFEKVVGMPSSQMGEVLGRGPQQDASQDGGDWVTLDYNHYADDTLEWADDWDDDEDLYWDVEHV